jgi:autotransporter-associated beta strand protein
MKTTIKSFRIRSLAGLLTAGVLLLTAFGAQAASVVWTNAATAVWTNATAWNPNGLLSSANDYVVNGAFTVQSVDAAISIFTGNSLSVSNGATIYLYRSNGGTSISATNYFTNSVAGTPISVTLSNAIIKLDSSLGSVLHHVKTPFAFKGTNTITYGTTDGYTLDLYLDSALTGSGSVNLLRGASGTSHQRDFYLTGDCSGYSGSWTNTGTGTGVTAGTLNFYTTQVSGWGSGNMTLNAYAYLNINAAITNPAPRVNLTAATAVLTVNNPAVIGSLAGIASSTATLNNSLTLADNTSTTFSGSLTGAGALTKNGTGTLTLPNVSLNTALTTVNAGTLIANGSLGGLTMNGGTTLAPGTAALTAGSLSVGGNLTLNTNTLALDISNTTGSGNDSISVSGNLILSGTNFINLNLLNGSTVAGPYTIITYGGTLTGGATNFQIVGSHAATIDLSQANQVNLWFTNGSPVNLVWVGNGTNNNWDAGITYDWFNGTGSDFFGQGDNVTFNDTATNLTVNVAGTISPNLFTVTNSTNNFVIQGGGTLGGGATLLKAGTASLTVSNANAFSGGTTISAGSIFAKNATAPLGTGTVTLGDANTGTNAPGLYITSKETFTNAIVISANGTGIATVGCDSGGGSPGTNIYSGTINLNQPLTLNCGSQVGLLRYNGVISGTGNLTLLGGSRIGLAAANNFSGNVYIQGAGTVLETTSGSGIPTAASVNVGPGSFLADVTDPTFDALTGSGTVEPVYGLGTVTVGANGGGGTFSGTLTNNGYALTLAKSGGGTQVLNGPDYATGNLNVNAGTLAIGASGSILNSTTISVAGGATFDVSAQGGSFALKAGQTLAGLGSVAGGFNTLSNAVIEPGGSGTGTLTFNNNLTLGGNAILTNVTTTGTGLSDLVQVGGNLNLSGTNFVALSSFIQQSLVPGTYQLISYSGTLTGGASNFVVSPVLTRLTMTPDTSVAGQVNLIVSGGSSNLVWNGGLNGNVWDVNTTSNWFNGVNTDYFFQQDGVTFSDLGGANTNVSLATALYPLSVTVNSSSNYILGGSGKISGVTGLTKSGTGKLVLGTTNDFSGGTIVNSGTLQIGSGTAGAAGSGNITNAATVTYYRADTAAISIANNHSGNGVFNITSTGTLLQGNFTLAGDNSGVSGTMVANNARVSVAGQANLGGAPVVVATNGGEFYLTAANTFTNTFEVAGNGWLETAGNLGAIRLQGNGTTVSGPVVLLGNSLFSTYASGDSGTISGVIGDGGAGYGFTKSGSGTLTLSGNNTYTGSTIVSNGTVNVTGNESAATGGWSMPFNYAAATVNFQAGSTVIVASNKSVQVGSSPSAGTPNNQTLNASGLVTNNGTLLVARGGYLNINAGGTWFQNGTLSVSPPSASGYGASMTVASGATFTYSGTNLIVLSPSAGNGGLGLLTINGGTFITGQGFTNTVTPPPTGTSGYAQIILTNNGNLVLSTNIPQLTSGFNTNSTASINTGSSSASGGNINTAGFSTTVTNIIGGSGSLTKLGAGTLTLGAANTYTGATVVSNGTLAVTGKLAPGSAVSVYATLAGTGFIGGPTTIAASGLVQPGNGTLTISNLTLGASSTDVCTNAFNIGAGGNIFTTTLNVTGTNIVNILDASLTVGTNNLIYYTGTIGGNGLGGLVLGTLPANTTAYLTNSPTAVQLVVTSAGVPPVVTVTPASTNVFVTGTAVFTANVTSGTAPFIYQWYDNHTTSIAGATNSSLTLTNLAVTQSGNYTVMVTNAVGNASALGALTVNPLVAPALSGGVSLGGGGFQLTFSGPVGETFKVISATNLVTPLAGWTVLTNGIFGVGSVTFVDSTATNHPQRFYLITAP